MIKKPLVMARELVGSCLKPGFAAVDATCGNGHDTVYLAECVGPGGVVYAFDVQEQAIAGTKKRLADAGLLDRVKLLHGSHGDEHRWPAAGIGAVMFNLGYLPGGDHTLVTQPDSTVAALRAAAARLNRGGMITLVIYTGHPGGYEEFAAVRQYAASLPQENFTVLEYRTINQINDPPSLLAIFRL